MLCHKTTLHSLLSVAAGSAAQWNVHGESWALPFGHATVASTVQAVAEMCVQSCACGNMQMQYLQSCTILNMQYYADAVHLTTLLLHAEFNMQYVVCITWHAGHSKDAQAQMVTHSSSRCCNISRML